MNPITDLSKLIIGQSYCIEVIQTEYECNTENENGYQEPGVPVEIKYKFIGKYSGVSELKVVYEHDTTKLTPQDMEYKYTFDSFNILYSRYEIDRVNGITKRRRVIEFASTRDDRYVNGIPTSFPLDIHNDNCLRISQLDVLNNKTKVYLSYYFKYRAMKFDRRHILRQLLEFKLKGHSEDIINYTSEFLFYSKQRVF